MRGVGCNLAETCDSLVGFGVPGAQNAQKNAHKTDAGVDLRFGARIGRIWAATGWDGGYGVERGVFRVLKAKAAESRKNMDKTGLKKIVMAAGAKCACAVHSQRHRRQRNGWKRIFWECGNAICGGQDGGHGWGYISAGWGIKKIPFGTILKIPVEIRQEILPYQ